jgi:hypothetical protein
LLVAAQHVEPLVAVADRQRQVFDAGLMLRQLITRRRRRQQLGHARPTAQARHSIAMRRARGSHIESWRLLVDEQRPSYHFHAAEINDLLTSTIRPDAVQ